MARLLLLLALALLPLAVVPALASDDGSKRGYRFEADETLPQRARTLAVSEPGASAASVFGPDERVRVTDTTQFPWSAVAFLELYDAEGFELGMCTGTFIGPHVLLTPPTASTMTTAAGSATSQSSPAGTAPPSPSATSSPTHGGSPRNGANRETAPTNWGLLVLPDDTLGNTVGWLRIANLGSQTLMHPGFTPAIAGYPADKAPVGSMWFGAKPAFVAIEEFFLRHDIDTFPGASGSAVFSANLDSPYLGDIVGIHVLGGPSYNRASRIDHELLGYLLDACEEAGCQFDYFEEGGATVTASPTATPSATPTPTPTPSPTAAPSPAPTATVPGNRPFRGVVPAVSRD